MPNEIKRIIRVSGFDNHLSILALTPSDIPDIEKCVNDNKNIFKNSNIYSVTEQFVLKPGHRTLILNLPEKFKEFLESEKEVTEKKVEKSKTELAIELTQKLEKYLNDLNYSVQFTSDSVTFESENKSGYISCRIKCPFCGFKLLCNYIDSWVISNITAHFRKDIEKLTEQSTEYIEHVDLNSNSDQLQNSVPKVIVINPADMESFIVEESVDLDASLDVNVFGDQSEAKN